MAFGVDSEVPIDHVADRESSIPKIDYGTCLLNDTP